MSAFQIIVATLFITASLFYIAYVYVMVLWVGASTGTRVPNLFFIYNGANKFLVQSDDGKMAFMDIVHQRNEIAYVHHGTDKQRSKEWLAWVKETQATGDPSKMHRDIPVDLDLTSARIVEYQFVR